MELVDFMSNRDYVVETLKEKGLIEEDGAVTEKGLMAIQFYLDTIGRKGRKLGKVQTDDMLPEEVEEWEKEYKAASVGFDNGGVLEFFPVEMFDKDDEEREKGTGAKAIVVSMCDAVYENEILEIVSSKDEIRKLRDMLNNFLEG